MQLTNEEVAVFDNPLGEPSIRLIGKSMGNVSAERVGPSRWKLTGSGRRQRFSLVFMGKSAGSRQIVSITGRHAQTTHADRLGRVTVAVDLPAGKATEVSIQPVRNPRSKG